MTNNIQEEPQHISISVQYIKDLSFENPGTPRSLVQKGSPEIDLSLDILIQKMPEDNCFEVALHIEVEANCSNEKMFLIELVYAGIFSLINIPENEQRAVLNIHCTSMIFPFARKIISDITQYGGFQPLMIDPIDFGRLFYQRTQQSQ